MNIYNIQQELLEIFNEIEENDGEVTPELEEKLSIKQEDFKNKIKSYTDVIKMLQSDIDNIKKEKDRLMSLQTSKEKTIKRLEEVIISATETFGDITKSGSKFIDFGTGKVSIRTSQKVDIDEAAVDRFVNRYFSCLSWYNMQNQLSKSILDSTDILDFVNSPTDIEVEDGIVITSFNSGDLSKLGASVALDFNFKELFETEEGFELAKALINYNDFKVKAKVNKTDLKKDIKESHSLPSFAKLIDSKSVTIK